MKIEFFPASDAKPVLLIYDATPVEVSAFQEALFDLGKGNMQEVEVHSLPGVEAIDGCQLVARLSQSDEGVNNIGNGKNFEWLLSATCWEDVAEMVEPMKEPWQGGHSFLDYKGKVSVIMSSGRGW